MPRAYRSRLSYCWIHRGPNVILDLPPETFSMNPCIVHRRQIDSQKTQIQEANATIRTMHGEMEHMRGKVDEALKLIDVAKSLEEKIASVQKRQGFRLYSAGGVVWGCTPRLPSLKPCLPVPQLSPWSPSVSSRLHTKTGRSSIQGPSGISFRSYPSCERRKIILEYIVEHESRLLL